MPQQHSLHAQLLTNHGLQATSTLPVRQATEASYVDLDFPTNYATHTDSQELIVVS